TAKSGLKFRLEKQVITAHLVPYTQANTNLRTRRPVCNRPWLKELTFGHWKYKERTLYLSR
ncbi:MAG: hypothetical protein KAS98_12750, partial [Deltaproteobacteria bacterium]|nr:hypothetical protein [Deltaproteobacteria bacterium]